MVSGDELIAALEPFALYGEQQSARWSHHDDCVFYGVKRPGAHQISYGDFRRATSHLDMKQRALVDRSGGQPASGQLAQ